MIETIADRRLEGETLLRQCQLTELYILDTFAEICKKYNLRYFLDSGTLLGAIRHGGFIPWDDDVDVCMPLDDFKRFIRIANSTLPDNLILESPSFFFGYPDTFAKLRDRSSFFCEKQTNVQMPSGIYIDIFPFSKFPARPKRVMKWIASASTAATESRKVYLRKCVNTSAAMVVSAFFAMIWLVISRFAQLFVRLVSHFTKCNWRYCVGCGFVSQIGIAESDLFPLTKVGFEGHEYYAPHSPEALLTAYYGDWRKLPPPEKRQWHASIICPTQAPDAPWARKYQPQQ